MAGASVAEFLDVLRQSRLLTADELAEARDLHVAGADGEGLARTLVRRGCLTGWQAGQLLAGRTSFFLGKYKLIDVLGRGGMGTVFLGEHTRMRRCVALKIVSKEIGADPAALNRFLAEARAIAALDHPNIVRAYSVDNEGDRYYIVMEYVAGRDLQAIVAEQGPLDYEVAADCIRQAAEGLEHAHSRGMIHCDIKPSNLLVNHHGTVKIADMGTARLVGLDHSQVSGSEGRVLGSVDYLAPEQALETPDFDHRADIYALGCTFYFLLTGRPPFPEGSLHERIVKHQTQQPEGIVRFRPDAPKDLLLLCRGMLAKRAADRPASAHAIAQTLTQWRPPKRKLLRAVPLDEPAGVVALDTEGPPAQAAAATDDYAEREATGIAGTAPVLDGGGGRRRSPPAAVRWMVLGAAAAVLLGGVLVARILLRGAGEANGILAAGESSPGPPGTSLLRPPLEPADADTEEDHPWPEPQYLDPVDEGDLGDPSGGPPDDQASPAAEVDSAAGQPPADKTEPPLEEAADAEEPEPESAVSEVTPPPGNPFSSLPSAVELPAIPSEEDVPAGGAVIGTLEASEDRHIELALLGGEQALRGPRSLQMTAESARRWLVRTLDPTESDGGDSTPVAELWLADGVLRFAWLPSAAAGDGGSLRFCALEATCEEHSVRVALGTPMAADPLPIDCLAGSRVVSLPLASWPDFDYIRVEITGSEGPLPALRTEPAPLFAPHGETTLVFTEEGLARVGINVAWQRQGRAARLQVRSFHELGGQRALLRRAEVERLALAASQAETAREVLNQQLQSANNDPQREAIQTQLNLVTSRANELKRIVAFCRNAHNNAFIHYRVFVEVEGEPHELIRSRPRESLPANGE